METPYCKICDSCGEDGCCSWLNCFGKLIQNDDCKYGDSYYYDALLCKVMLEIADEIFTKLKNGEISAEEAWSRYDKEYDENWDNLINK